MTATSPFTALATIQAAFTDAKRLALAATARPAWCTLSGALSCPVSRTARMTGTDIASKPPVGVLRDGNAG